MKQYFGPLYYSPGKKARISRRKKKLMRRNPAKTIIDFLQFRMSIAQHLIKAQPIPPSFKEGGIMRPGMDTEEYFINKKDLSQ